MSEASATTGTAADPGLQQQASTIASADEDAVNASTSIDYLDLCRLCLQKDSVNLSIFEEEGEQRQMFLKISATLPVKIFKEDKLPKKICDDCSYKVELLYQFWNTAATSEKQLLQWLGEIGLDDKQNYEVLEEDLMKSEKGNDNRLNTNIIQVSDQNSIEISMIDNISLITIPAGSEQFTTVPIDASGTIQTEAMQSSHDQSQIEEDRSEMGDMSDDGCDNEGLPVKEESDDQNNQANMDQAYVSIEAGPSGIQHQKISELTIQQAADGDPKTGSTPQQRQPNLSISAHKVTTKLHPKQMAKFVHPEDIKIERVESLAPQTKSTVGGADFEEVFIDGSDMIDESNNKTTNQQQSAAQETSEIVVYMCTPCKTYFPTKTLLEEHHKEEHAATKPAMKKLKLQQLLMQLKQEQQPKPRPRFDQQENKVFFQLYHKDLNTNEFVCNFCPYRSVIRTTVSSHAKRNHTSSGSDNDEEEESFEMIKTKEEQEDVEEELYDETLVDEMKIEMVDEEMMAIHDEDDESSWPIETVDETFEEQLQNNEPEAVSDNEDRPRVCPYCPFQSSVTSTYHSHVKRKHREEWLADVAARVAALKPPEGPELQCQHCDFTTHKRNTLHSHVKRKHGLKRKLDETGFDDIDENFVEVKEEMLDESEAALVDGATDSDLQSKMRSCPYCDFQTRNTSTFNSHVLRKHGSNAKRSSSGLGGPSGRSAVSKKSKTASNSFMITGYACHYCAFVAATIHSLTSHNTRMHASMKQPVQEIPTDQFDCDRCEYKTRNRRNMQTHLKKNHKGQANADGMYCCNACSYETMSHVGLQRHMSIKHQKPNLTNNLPCYQCEICEFKCLNIKIMDWHLKSHMGSSKAEESGIIFFCNDCDFSTWLKTLLFSHIRRKHKDGEGKDEQEEGEPLFVCEQCDYSTKNKHVMKVHVIRRHTENYSHECDICGKKYKVKADLTNHVRFKHREQPIICDVCGKTCQNSNLLYLHQKFAHYKPEFECPICHRRMVSQANLDDHILKQHEQRENVVCEECGKQFTRASRLKIHMRTHTGLKPYSCKVCLKSFARRNGLRQHLLIHTGKKPYSCDLCDKSFTQKTGLISHRKSHPGSHPPLPRVTIDHVLSNLLEERQ